MLGFAIAALGTTWLQADSESHSSSMRVLRSEVGYQAPPVAAEFVSSEGYVAAPLRLEREGFTTEELRETLTQTSETKYVDVARFRGIQAPPD